MIHCIIPSDSYEVLSSRLLPSLAEFDKIKTEITFGIVFQHYTDKEIEKVIKAFDAAGLTLLYTQKKYYFPFGRTPLIEMRNDAALLNPTADYYLNIDDDSQYIASYPFNIADILHSCIQYMETNLKCGCIMIGPGTSGIIHRHGTSPSSTGLGLLLRNIYEDGNILPKEMIRLEGNLQDALCVYKRWVDGYFPADANALCGEHVNNKHPLQQGKFKRGWLAYNAADWNFTRYHVYKIYMPQLNNFRTPESFGLDKEPDEIVIPKRDTIIN